MSKLNREDIQFIDKYLENSNIIYADIRMEMVDHIASDIESKTEDGDPRDFYHIFKDYMVVNKSKLLNNNKQFLKSADKKILKAFLRQSSRLETLIFLLASIFNFYYINEYFGYETFQLFLFMTPLLTFLGFGILYFIKTRYSDLKRFSVVERLSFPFSVFYHVFIFTYHLTNIVKEEFEIVVIILIGSIAMTIFYVLISITLQFIREYSQRFKLLV
ncbi:MAG: hypothetical protein NWP87_01710 [Winogradskyella sp.]|nr:hypothetical protein [Winogradskyella sp.]